MNQRVSASSENGKRRKTTGANRSGREGERTREMGLPPSAELAAMTGFRPELALVPPTPTRGDNRSLSARSASSTVPMPFAVWLHTPKQMLPPTSSQTKSCPPSPFNMYTPKRTRHPIVSSAPVFSPSYSVRRISSIGRSRTSRCGRQGGAAEYRECEGGRASRRIIPA